MTITLPDPSLVLLVGPSGSGKSTFAGRHFRPTEVVSSDACRALVADDPADQSVTPHAFDVLHLVVAKRLLLGRLTVVDATNLQRAPRASLLRLAKDFYTQTAAVVFDLPEDVCVERDRRRPGRTVGPDVVRQQQLDLRRAAADLAGEGLRAVYRLTTPDEIDAAAVVREPLPADRRADRGPFDVIGDVHGCGDELEELLARLGYVPAPLDPPDPVWGDLRYAHPAGRTAVFVGDLVDRGPRVVDVVRLVRNMVAGGSALCVQGNHDQKVARRLRGRDALSPPELLALPDAVRDAAAGFLDGLPSHYVLDGGRLVVAHAGLPPEMHGRDGRRVRSFALFGDTTGETDEFGLPVRRDWAAHYRGHAAVAYGHTPVAEPVWRNGTVNLDTGCAFGGRLTALRWPERAFVAVPARRAYCEPKRPIPPAEGVPASPPP